MSGYVEAGADLSASKVVPDFTVGSGLAFPRTGASSSKYLDQTGAFSTPASAGGSGIKDLVFPLAGYDDNLVGAGAGSMYVCRHIVPPGVSTLTGMMMHFGVSSGNFDLGVFDTSATTRNRLFHTGLTASPGTGYQQLATPNLAVSPGDHIDCAFVCDNNSITIGFKSLASNPPAGNRVIHVADDGTETDVTKAASEDPTMVSLFELETRETRRKREVNIAMLPAHLELLLAGPQEGR